MMYLSLFIAAAAVMMMMMAVHATAMPSSSSSLSSLCDIHMRNITAGVGFDGALVFPCKYMADVFATEKVAFRAIVKLLTNNPSLSSSSSSPSSSSFASVKIVIADGDDCQPSMTSSYLYNDTCTTTTSSRSQQHSVCEVAGLTRKKINNVWCLIVWSLSGTPVQVSVDLNWLPASYDAQWHLHNTGQMGGIAGNDVNAEGAWSQGAFGKDVIIMIVDQGIQTNHVELAERLVLSLSWSPQNQTRDTTPWWYRDDHGVACAGVAAAAMNNYCGSGIAPQASIAGYKILGRDYQADVAGYVRAMYVDEVSDDGRRVSINSNSWGQWSCTEESGCFFVKMVPQLIASIQHGADTGRNGLGVVYLFAAGNEGHAGGDANIMHYCKLPEVMCIAGSDFTGVRVFYSNAGANLFVNAPTAGQWTDALPMTFPGIATAQFSIASTTDCMGDFGGTSSATPLVAGIAALILGVRPDLSWRDVQHIIQISADHNDASSSTWIKNGAGVWFSHIYGFGRINAGNAVSLAKKWYKLGNVTGTSTPIISVATNIIDNSPLQPVISKWIWSSRDRDLPETIEHIMVYVTIDHNRPQDLRMLLTSPYGTTAILALPQKTNTYGALVTYPLAARTFWNESPIGIWTITVSDEIAEEAGTFVSWSMEVQGNGTSIK